MRVTLDNNVLVSARALKSPGFAWLRQSWRELILASGDDLLVLKPVFPVPIVRPAELRAMLQIAGD